MGTLCSKATVKMPFLTLPNLGSRLLGQQIIISCSKYNICLCLQKQFILNFLKEKGVFCFLCSYVKPLYMESNEFLEDIIAGPGSKQIEPKQTPLTIDEIIASYRVSDHYKDVMRIVNDDDKKHLIGQKVSQALVCHIKHHPSTAAPLMSSQDEKQGTKLFHMITRNMLLCLQQMHFKGFKNKRSFKFSPEYSN